MECCGKSMVNVFKQDNLGGLRCMVCDKVIWEDGVTTDQAHSPNEDELLDLFGAVPQNISFLSDRK